MTFIEQSPTYSIKQFRDDYYKLIKYNRPVTPHLPSDRKVLEPDLEALPDRKFRSALVRASSVIKEIAICNDWQYFFTCTLNGNWHNRYDINPFRRVFPQWVRDYRKKYHCDLKYLVVPEQHKDGAWHIHGFIMGLPESHLTKFVPGFHPRELIDKGYSNWPELASKFGFCSLSPVNDIIKAGHYVAKYLTKDLTRSVSDFGGHLYYASVGLRRSVRMGYVYGQYTALDVRLSSIGQFCSVGYISDWSWSDPYTYLTDIILDGEFSPVLPDQEEEQLIFMSNLDYQFSFDDYLSRGEGLSEKDCFFFNGRGRSPWFDDGPGFGS